MRTHRPAHWKQSASPLKNKVSMPVRLTFVCHGATAATRAAAFPLDEPLEDRAMAKARALGRLLPRADWAWTSPALRARQTSEALALDASIHPALRDCDYGRWSGCRLADIERAEPDSVATWLSDPNASPHGGEALADLFRRVAAWMDETRRNDGRTIAVTHAAVIRAAILHVLDGPARSFWRIDVEPLSAIDLRWDGARWTLRYLSGSSRAGRDCDPIGGSRQPR